PGREPHTVTAEPSGDDPVSGTEIGSMLGATGLAGLLVATDRRLRAAAFGAFAVGRLILTADLLHSPASTLPTDAGKHPALAAVALALGVGAAVVGAAIAHRFTTLTLVAVVATAPARIPVHAGGQDANLLVGLYAVLFAMALACAYELVVGTERAPALGPIGWAAAALVLWSAISLTWTSDQRQGGVEMLFFLLPFGFMLSRLAALGPTARQLRLMLGMQVALAVAFGAVALWQYATHDLFWNQKIMVDNQYSAYYRVNSLFYDASIYGRFMAVTIVL